MITGSTERAEALEDDDDSVLCYGISFFRKRCLVRQK